jgi:hypothetical protein
MTDPAVPPAAPAPVPVAAGPKQTLSITGFVIGLVAFIFGWTPIFGLLAGIAAIIVSVIAHKREPAAPGWMWIIGLVGGIIGAVVSLIFTIGWIVALAFEATTIGTLGSVY